MNSLVSRVSELCGRRERLEVFPPQLGASHFIHTGTTKVCRLEPGSAMVSRLHPAHQTARRCLEACPATPGAVSGNPIQLPERSRNHPPTAPADI